MALTWKGGCGGGGGSYVAGDGIIITGNVISAEVTQQKLDDALDNLLEGTITGITVTTAPTKTAYNSGDALDLSGMVVSVMYANGKSQAISGYTASPANGATLTDTDSVVNISWTHEGNTYNTTQAITVSRVLSSIAVTQPTKASYTEGDTLDLSGAVVTASYTSGSTANVTSSATFTPANGSMLSAVGTVTITASYTEGGITKTATTTVTVSSPVSDDAWTDGSWSDIANMLAQHDAGTINIYDYIKVGDTRKVRLSAMAATGVGESHVEQDVEIVILDKNVVDLAGGGKCHFVIGLKDGLANGTTGEYGYMNSTNTNAGGWESCARRTWCNNVFANAVPSDLKAMMKPASIKSSAGSQSTTIKTTTDTWFLPAEYNVFGTTSYSASGEDTVQWEYYKTAANRIKKTGTNGSADYWWERSPYVSNTNFFCIVNSYGDANFSNANANLLVAPCGCI